MELLHQQLLTWPASRRDTRIVRYERFKRGYSACLRVFGWLFGADRGAAYKSSVQQSCEPIFNAKTQVCATGRHCS